MKIDIKYFTSTGNTLWLAEKAAEIWRDGGIEVNLTDSAENRTDFDPEADIVGIIYPVWASNLPAPLIENLKVCQPSNRPMFLIGTCGMFTGDTGIFWRKKIQRELGYNVFYVDDILMPINMNVPMRICDSLKPITRKRVESMVPRWEARVRRICSEISVYKKRFKGRGPFSVLGGKLQRAFEDSVYRSWTKKFQVHQNKCRGCGLCARICPSDNLELINGEIRFGSECIMCLRCYNHCPDEAILLGHKTLDNKPGRRYRGPVKGIAARLIRSEKNQN